MKNSIRVLGPAVCSLAILLAAAGRVEADLLYSANAASDQLVAIETNSFDVTIIGPLGFDYAAGGLAYDPNSDTLYLASGGGDALSLFTVNRDTGAATEIGRHGASGPLGLAFDSANDVLYGSSSGLFSLDPATGAPTLIGSFQFGRQIDGLAYDSLNDRLVGIDSFDGDLFEINRANAATTLLLDGPAVNLGGLAYDPDNNLFWDIDNSGNLYSYDPAGGFFRTTHLTGLDGFHNSLAYVSTSQTSAVPEPSSLALMGIAIAVTGLNAARRRGRKKGTF